MCLLPDFVRRVLLCAGLLCTLSWAQQAQAVGASRVWFEFHPTFYRVLFTFTLPQLKESREGHADFRSKAAAVSFYWSLVRGGDVRYGDPKAVSFETEAPQAEPW